MAPGSHNATLAVAHGYVEQEYLLSGAANIYRYGADERVAVETPDVPYTTRLLVARPSDPARFSGRVFLVPFHPARGSGFWESLRDYVMREGDIYVGVFIGTDERSRAASAEEGSPADGLSLMRAYGDGRYADLVWPEDDGIRWDVFGQTAQLLRGAGADNALRDLPVTHMYAIGWSFTGSFLRTYVNEGFHDTYRRANGDAAIDGYLIGISQHAFRSGYVTINSHTPALADDDPRRPLRAIDAPVIELMTENEAVTRREAPRDGPDAGLGRLRTYEAPGVTHGDGLRDTPAPSECPYPESDVAFRLLAWGALENLDAWVRTGVAPPHQRSPLDVDYAAGRAVLDEFGNARGGLRAPEIAVPLARYGAVVDDARCAPRASYYLATRRVPLSQAQLAQVYPGGTADYLRQFEHYLDALIAQRWILPEDKADEMDRARAAAAEAFAD